jgi:hypothetical protein
MIKTENITICLFVFSFFGNLILIAINDTKDISTNNNEIISLPFDEMSFFILFIAIPTMKHKNGTAFRAFNCFII